MKPIETDIWRPKEDDPRYSEYVGQRSAEEVFRELEQLCPDKALVDVFRIKYDYHNAKVILKAEAMGSDPASLMSRAGRVKPDAMLSAYREERLGELPGEPRDAECRVPEDGAGDARLLDGLVAVQQGRDPSRIDRVGADGRTEKGGHDHWKHWT